MFRKLLRALIVLANHDCVLDLTREFAIRADLDINGNTYYVIYDEKRFITFKDGHNNTILRLNKHEIKDIYKCIALTVNILIHYFNR